MMIIQKFLTVSSDERSSQLAPVDANQQNTRVSPVKIYPPAENFFRRRKAVLICLVHQNPKLTTQKIVWVTDFHTSANSCYALTLTASKLVETEPDRCEIRSCREVINGNFIHKKGGGGEAFQ